jgi:catechol 2,3-dioxygenase-like lactoylglutathione lyase family enzyme
MLASATLVAFVPTTDLERSHAFYGGLLGLRRVESSPFANAYDCAGTRLRVARVESFDPHPFTVVGWRVSDLAATVAALRAAGVEPLRYDGMDQDTDGAWLSPQGARIAWFHDADGNTLSIAEPPA